MKRSEREGEKERESSPTHVDLGGEQKLRRSLGGRSGGAVCRQTAI